MSFGVATRNSAAIGLAGIASLFSGTRDSGVFAGENLLTESGDSIVQEDGSLLLLDEPFWSLFLDFTTSNALDSRITFTRASTATFFNSAGVLTSASNDVARFDYDPSTLAPRGLLIEEQRTNLFIRSEEFDTWNLTGATIVANTIVAPDGTLTGDKLVEDATTGGHVVAKAVLVTSGTAYTFSYYAKKAERTQCGLLFAVGGFGTSTTDIFDLDAGTVVTNASGTAAITPVGNGWYRVSATRTATATASSSFQIRIASGGSGSYPGDGTSGIYIWGAQLEAGAFPTSYIPTTTTALTRNADVASMTGTNFSSWFNNAEGTLLTQISAASGFNVANTFGRFATIQDAFGNNTVEMFFDGNANQAPRYRVRNGGTNQVIGNAAVAYTANTVLTSTLAYKENDFAGVSRGTVDLTDTSGLVPSSPTFLSVGSEGGSLNFLNGYIRRIAYYPTRLPDATLQALTA